MRGHFKKRGGAWYFWAELEAGPDGRRRQKAKGGFRTRKDAERAFAEFRDHVRTGGYVEPGKATLAQYLVDEWLPATRLTVRPTTWLHYESEVRAYVVPRIGQLRLSAITPARLNALYAELLTTRRRDGSRTLSPTTVRRTHNMLHKALGDAVRWGRLAANPADRADPPRAATTEMRVWAPAQLRAFLDHVGEDRLYAAWLLLATTGMRRGELLGLGWEQVDLTHRRISVVRSLTVVGSTTQFSEPKTAKGRRLIALDDRTADALGRHRRRQVEERLALGSAWTDTGLVFTRDDGTAIHPERMSAWFAQRSRERGLPAIRLHDVRHSYATAALTAGVPTKMVSERLGHATSSITLDTYSHVLPSMHEEAASLIAEVILGPAGREGR